MHCPRKEDPVSRSQSYEEQRSSSEIYKDMVNLLEKKLKTSVGNTDKLTSENATLKKALDDCKEANEKLSNQVSVLEKKYIEMKMTVQGKNEEIEKQNGVVEAKEVENRRCCEKNKVLSEENFELKNKFFEKQCEVDRLQDLKSTHEKLLQEIHYLEEKLDACVSSNRTTITCQNLQMGDSNNMVSNSLAKVESRMSQLLESMENLFKDKEEKEKELRKVKVEKEEEKEMLAHIIEDLKKFDNETLSKNTAECLEEIQDALEMLLTDRSDNHVIAEGVNRLKHEMARCDDKRQNFSFLSGAAMARITKKLENSSLDDLVEVFELDSQIIKGLIGNGKLDRSVMENILVAWMLKSSENNGDRLIEQLKKLVKVSEETEEKFYPLTTEEDDENLQHVPRRDGIMDEQTRDMHVLLLCESVADIKKCQENMQKDLGYIKGQFEYNKKE